MKEADDSIAAGKPVGFRSPWISSLLRVMVWVGLILTFLTGWLWCGGALYYSNLPWIFARSLMAIAFLVGVPLALIFRDDRMRVLRRALAAAALIMIWQLAIRPSNDRNWTVDQQRLATAQVSGDRVTVRNIRNFIYRAEEDYDARYYDAVFDVGDLETVWFGVERFGGFEGVAHTFLSFGFKGDRYLAVSVEIRKERGETFSVFKGLYKHFELMYVIGDERDIIGLRSNIRKDPVYLFPARSDDAGRRRLFLSVMSRINKLVEKPEYYDTLVNNCTTTIADHVNELIPGKVPWERRVILPGYSGELAYELGLLDTDLPYEEAQRRFHINERAERFADDPEFSVKIRH